MSKKKSLGVGLLLAALPSLVVLLPNHAASGVETVPVHTPVAVSSLFGGSGKQKFLPVNQAFQVQTRQVGDSLQVSFQITPNHYIYRDKLKLDLPEGVQAGAWQFDSAASMVDDPQFGRVAVFDHAVNATIALSRTDAAPAGEMAVTLHWQGCAKAGLCYPPERVPLKIKVSDSVASTSARDGASEAAKKTSAETDEQASAKTDTKKTSQPDSTPERSDTAASNSAVANAPASTASDNNTATTPEKLEDLNAAGATTEPDAAVTSASVAPTIYTLNHTPSHSTAPDPFGLASRPVLAVFLLFLAGLVLAFSACIYPMIPIIAHIVARDKNPSALRGLLLTGAYALGVAVSYGLLGAVVAWFGKSLGIIGWLQNPWVLSGFALFFALLALQMFGVIGFELPNHLRERLARASHAADGRLGSVTGSFLVGLLSALVVSPCVSAPLGGALAAMSAIGNVWLGFFALFALGLGLSLPLVLVGAAQGKWMPKAGLWMAEVKIFAGFMLLLVALVLIGRMLASPVILIGFALWFVLFGLWLYRLKRLPFRAVGILSVFYSGVLLLGFAMGSNDPRRPLALMGAHEPLTTQAHTQDLRVSTLAELDVALASNPKVIVYATADWCVVCRVMDRTIFSARSEAMHDWQLVKLDITEASDDSRAILARYGLFGPPALMYYQHGSIQAQQIGEVTRAEFDAQLAKLD